MDKNNKNIALLSYFIINEVNPMLIGAAKQAATWGISSAMATKMTQDKVKTKEEKRKQLKNLAISGIMGAGAGAIGHYLGSK